MKRKTVAELQAIIGSAKNLLTPYSDNAQGRSTHKYWRQKTTGDIAVVDQTTPILVTFETHEPRVMFGDELAAAHRVDLTLPVADFLSQFEPVEEYPDWRPLRVA